MLTSIHVRNFAIIDEVEVEFSPGMTVLTGETGAGKSILVDALGLVLGERGGSGLVRNGAKRAEFTAEFELGSHKNARDWLSEQMLDLDDECILRRVINADGRSRAFINGNTVPLQSLKTLGEMLLDIHGQHFHQSLARRDIQRNLLDYFGGLADLAMATRNAFDEWRSLTDKLQEIEAANSDRSARMELLQFQIGEIDGLDLQADEYANILQERSKLQNSGRLAEGVNSSLNLLFDADSGNAQSILAEVGQTINRLADMDETLRPTLRILEEAGIQVTEAVDSLRRYGDSLDMDPARRDWVEERLDAINNIARKHRIDADGIDDLHATMSAQLDDLIHADERSSDLKDSVATTEVEYRSLALKLTKGRKTAAKSFSSAVSKAMGDLGMPGGIFEVSITPRDPADARGFGLDDIEYLISANPGQKPQPLSRIASGGELSRMSLAIQVIASDGSLIPTMVFDEVDSGVGGGIAEMVGIRLRDLGQSRQVFCVTHLPQVASQAANHFRIMKLSDGKTTKTSIAALSMEERIEEIARMLGGVEITQRTLDHAAEMLDSSGARTTATRRA